MTTITVRPENFEKAVRELIVKYGDEATEITTQAAKTAARKTVSDLKSQSPVGHKGSYARGWSHKAQKGGVASYSDTVYNRTDYQLTHLLENPHPTGHGGHYPSKKDHTGIIARIEQKQVNDFIEEVMKKL
jgi:hypothetical protein